ncbi:MAG: type II and III secretion system protein family protein [Desulfobacteraceae bacterium]|nr:MAG: type II and III secretion system protein family protein [Desulfobacteraceae bacterium]
MIQHKAPRMSLSLTIIMFVFFVCSSWSLGYAETRMLETEIMQIPVGKSVIVKSLEPVKRVSLADPAVANFVLISPHEVYITGKAVGTTNMTLWQDKSGHKVYDVEVVLDVSMLKQRLHEILPGENDLRVTAANDSLTLSGRVSNAVVMSEALALARAHAPEAKVNNLIEVGGVHQVMLEVRVAEMQRSLIRRLGVNFNYVTDSGKFGITQLAGLTQLVRPTDSNIGATGPFATFVSPAVNALLRFRTAGATWTGFVDALKQDGLVKVLAEPTLIALSGHQANFLAGGEFPVPVPQGLGTVAIEYKKFGVGLVFTPTVLSDGKINIKVAPEVSELDFTTAVQFSGFVIPGLTTRTAETVIELADGQSFAIAGLLKDNIRDVMDKFPLLGDIPILGALFRSRSFQKSETELIIIATPHLVKPLDKSRQSLPTDYYTEPSDAELYIFGLMQGRDSSRPRLTGELDGEFGHAMPGRN